MAVLKGKIQFVSNTIKRIWSVDESYTLMLVPDDGTDIKKRSLENRHIKKAVCAGGIAGFLFFGCFTIMSMVIYKGVTEQRELEEYRQTKALQEQKLQELSAMTENVQKNMAALNQLEKQLRVQMEKSGLEVPEKSVREQSQNGKGGPVERIPENMRIILEQNKTLLADQHYSSGELSKLLAVLKQENYRKDVTPDLWPVYGGYVSSEFGSRSNPFDNTSPDFHPGMDIAANYGTPIYATASGTVIRASWYGGYGKYILIEHDYGYSTAFGHLSSIDVSAGDYVNKGQVIGYVGSTGYSTGPHLHYEVLQYGEPINPRKLMK